MIVQSKKREKVGWSQPESWWKYNNTAISRRKTEKMFELMIESEMEKKRSKLISDMFMRSLELQELKRGMDFLQEKHSSAIEWRRLVIELCNLTDTGPIGEVQNSGLPRDVTVAGGGNHINPQTSPSKDENNIKVDLYKTEICRSWKKFGSCIYDDCCHFAHGIGELRVRPKPHRNYKTEMCRKFLSGFCPYGTRCCFVHNPNEQYNAITGGSISGRQIVPNRLQGVMVHSKENRDMIRRWHRCRNLQKV